MTYKDPDSNCTLCPRLVEFREDNQAKYPDFFNGAVPSFGPLDAGLLVVGLAPGLKGANRTGRPFTGDYAGDLLYPTLKEFGFATGTFGADINDGLQLVGARITNAVRCVPPQNKPTAIEANTCRPFLLDELAAMTNLKVMLSLGRISHDSTLTSLGLKKSAYPFGHNVAHDIGNGVHLVDSYHCSRYNVNTKRLTPEMFHDVFRTIKTLLP